MTNKKM